MLLKHVVFVLLLACSFAHAAVYTWINSEGIRVYGDEPPANSQKAKLPKLQSLKHVEDPTKKDVTTTTNTEDTETAFKGYKHLSVSTPTEDFMLTSGAAGNTSVTLELEPALEKGHEITLLLDGKPVGHGAQLQFSLENVTRGGHLLQAKIKYKGRLLISSEKRRFHVLRPSILKRPASR